MRPPWPAPQLVVIEARDRAALALERIAALGAPALGVAFNLRARSGARLRSGDDERGATLEAIAIAVPGATSPAEGEPTRVLILGGELITHELAALLEPLWRAEPAPYLVFADAHRALSVLAARGVAAPPRYGCATIAATLLAEGADRRRDHRPLDRLVRDELERALPEAAIGPKTSTKTQAQTEQMAARLGAEADALVELMRELTPRLRERRLTSVYSFECSLLPAVVDMERAGFGVDPARFEQIASSWVRERAAIEAGEPASRDADRVARLDKLISTYRYWARDYVGPDGRMHARLHPLATDSGRFSCTEPNLQQVPSEYTAPGLRACFVPAPGHRLIIADYAQIELRVAADLAPCDALRAVFRAGRDPHRATAATLAGKPEAAIDSHERKLAKAINFGFLFGMGARRFRSYAHDAYGLELDEQQAIEARDAFFRTYPGISAWHRRISAMSRQAERELVTVSTVMGRRRSFPVGKFSFNAALNIPVQGTAAEGFKLAMRRLQPALAEIGGRGVLVIHDEYIAEIPVEAAEAGRELVDRIMVEAMAELVRSVPIVVEAELGDHWS